MHKVDGFGALPGGAFTEGNPVTSTPATRVTADILNALQSELVNAIEGLGLVLDKGDNFQLSKSLQRLAGGGGNFLINPEGSIRQRPGSHTGNAGSTETLGAGGPDRWWARAGGSGDVGELRPGTPNADAFGAPSRSRAYMRFLKTTNATTGVPAAIRQSVEGVAPLAGQQVVLAFDAKKLGGLDLAIAGVEIEQKFGTNGSPSAPVTTALTSIGAVTIDGSWRRFVFTASLPDVTGKTLTANPHMKVRVKFAADQLFDVLLTGFVLARGGQDPGYLSRGQTLEQVLCMRYAETNQPNANAEGMDVGLWDTAMSLAAGDVETLKRAFRVEKYTVAGTSTTWYAHDESAGFITEGASTKHAVTSQAVGLGGTGYPRITSPPAGGTLRFLRAFWYHQAEIPD